MLSQLAKNTRQSPNSSRPVLLVKRNILKYICIIAKIWMHYQYEIAILEIFTFALLDSLVTHQSGKKFDAEEKMFLDLILHLRILSANEGVRQQC